MNSVLNWVRSPLSSAPHSSDCIYSILFSAQHCIWETMRMPGNHDDRTHGVTQYPQDVALSVYRAVAKPRVMLVLQDDRGKNGCGFHRTCESEWAHACISLSGKCRKNCRLWLLERRETSLVAGINQQKWHVSLQRKKATSQRSSQLLRVCGPMTREGDREGN